MKLIIYALILSLLACCGKLDEPVWVHPTPQKPDIVATDSSTLTINCFVGMQESHTRAAVDYILRDVNIYLYCSQFGIAKHYYQTVSGTGTLNIELVNGKYDIYVVGNYGSDLGERTYLWLLNNLKAEITTENDIHQNGRKMAMSVRQQVTVRGNTTLNLALERLSAKVTFNVSMSKDMAVDSKIVHLQLFNLNGRVSYFLRSYISNSNIGCIKSYPKLDVSSMTLKAVSKSWYIMENRQGNVGTITNPQQRAQSNAPSSATYLWLRIERNGKFIDYRIYLGENDTKNFDVMRNTNYVYNIVVAGENPADLRVSTVSLKFYSGEQSVTGPEYSPYDRFVWKDKTAYCMLHIVTTNQDPNNILSVSFAHQSGTLYSGWYVSYSCPYVKPQQYRQMREKNSYPVFKGTGTSTIHFSFWNGDYRTITNAFLFSITDSNGYSKQFTVTTTPLP